MNAARIHDLIQRCPTAADKETVSRILDILTMLNDRVTELENLLNATQKTARHADESAGSAALVNGIHHG